jgi:glutamyl-tRNA reductase
MPLVAFASLLGVSSEWLTAEAQVEQRHRTAAVEHLVRVASGLESAVLGEDQVLAQVRAAYSTACAHRTPGPLLHRLFHAALRTGKRVRHETGIARGNTSLAGAAVSALKRRLDGARGRSVLLVGAGEMNQIAADGLAKAGVKRLLITSRSIESARQLADRHGGEALPWSWRGEALAGVDACITATGAPHAVLDTASVRRAVMSREATAPLVIVDLAVPADVEAGARCGASLLYDDVESLAAAMRRDHDLRLQEVAHAEAIVAEECQRYLEWLDRRAADGRPARRLRA